MNHKQGILAISPLFVLLGFYLCTLRFIGNSCPMPIGLAFVVASIWGLFLLRGKKIDERITVLSQGATHGTIMYMVWIFVLAGIFSHSAKAMGALDATVMLAIQAIPGQFLPAGIFIISCIVSLAIGTSVGTVVALTPVASGIAAETGLDTAWMVAIVVGGSFFGDSLSFISDTTIAATQTQGCKMADKFKTNLAIVLPAAIVSIIIYSFTGTDFEPLSSAITPRWWLSLPYLLVIVLSLCGMNVLNILIIGIIATDLLGILNGAEISKLVIAAGEGLFGMCELIVITLMAGGLMNILKTNGGYDYIIKGLTKMVSGQRSAEAVIALLTAITNLFTANNTIAIITVSDMAKDMSSRYGIAPRRSASILDISSCFMQGLIPYGMQLLIAAGLASITPEEILPHLYYPLLTGVMLIISIISRYPSFKKSVPND